MTIFLREYGQATEIRFTLTDNQGERFLADVTSQIQETSEVHILRDVGGTATLVTSGIPTVTNLEAGFYQITFNSTLMQCTEMVIHLADGIDPPEWLDTELRIETYGHPNARHQFNLNDPTVLLRSTTHTGATIQTVTNVSGSVNSVTQPVNTNNVTLAAKTHTGAIIPSVTSVTGSVPLASGAATATSLTAVLNRIGAWTGTGDNTLLGAFQALMTTGVANPSDIGGGFNPNSHSLEALGAPLTELGSVPGATPTLKQAMMWTYMWLRNRTTSGSGLVKIHNDAGNEIAQAQVTDDSVTFIRQKFV